MTYIFSTFVNCLVPYKWTVDQSQALYEKLVSWMNGFVLPMVCAALEEILANVVQDLDLAARPHLLERRSEQGYEPQGLLGVTVCRI